MCVQVAPFGPGRYDGSMSHPQCRDSDSIDFLIATPKAASCCEAARSQPPAPNRPAHDAYTRLLHRMPPDPETLDDWAAEGLCRAPDECWVERRGTCPHGLVSWQVVLDELADDDARRRGR